MALIVEDGTGIANAESFISVADAAMYLAARGYVDPAWPNDNTLRETCLRCAADYMEQFYRLKWKGWRVTFTQRLSWPRNGVVLQDIGSIITGGHIGVFDYLVPNNVVPLIVAQANAEFALIAAANLIAGNPPQIAAPQDRAVLSEKIGQLATVYDPTSPVYQLYRAPAMMLVPYLDAVSGTVKLGRV